MNPIGQKITNYCYSECPNKIGIAKLCSKNYKKTVAVRGTNIRLEILKRTNHIIQTITNVYGKNNPNK